jgi:Protein of unknown function (DUF998)
MKRPTAALLTCGIVAGAMLPTVLWIDGATRPGYSLWHHGASQLGLGERASLQTGNFVLAGILVVGFSIGVRRVLQSGRGATWGSSLLSAAGIGLVVAGIVPTNPALGYPPGEPSVVTPGTVVHQVAGLFLFGGLSGAAFVLAPRLRTASRSWAPAGLLEHLSLLAGSGWLRAIGIYLHRNGTVLPRPLRYELRLGVGIHETAFRVNVRWVTPLGEETASTS